MNTTHYTCVSIIVRQMFTQPAVNYLFPFDSGLNRKCKVDGGGRSSRLTCDSPGVLGFVCSYYRQQVIVHQEVTDCRVTETQKGPGSLM